MTFFHELGRAATRDPELRSGTLVFDGTRVPVEALLDALQRGQTPKEFLSDYPTVPAEHVRIFVTGWEHILGGAESVEAARWKLLAHADWALISRRVARRIDAQAGDTREPPDLETLSAWAGRVVRELTGRCGKVDEDGNRDRGSRGVDDPLNAKARDPATETLHALVDAASSLRAAADVLQTRHPIHEAHARRLAEDVDRLITDLRQAVET